MSTLTQPVKPTAMVNVEYMLAVDAKPDDVFAEVDCVLDSAIAILDFEASNGDITQSLFGVLYLLRHARAVLDHRHAISRPSSGGANHG